jgi:hypothetical protein
VVALLKFATRAAWALLGIAIGVACVDVPLRPDGSPAEEECPKGAIEAMKALRLRAGDAPLVYVDAARKEDGPLIVYDGPVESLTILNTALLPDQTRLYGRIWTSGPRVVIRYYKARLPDGKVIPFCAMAGHNGPGLPKSPGRPGFAALEDSSAYVYVTGRFL